MASRRRGKGRRKVGHRAPDAQPDTPSQEMILSRSNAACSTCPPRPVVRPPFFGIANEARVMWTT